MSGEGGAFIRSVDSTQGERGQIPEKAEMSFDDDDVPTPRAVCDATAKTQLKSSHRKTEKIGPMQSLEKVDNIYETPTNTSDSVYAVDHFIDVQNDKAKLSDTSNDTPTKTPGSFKSPHHHENERVKRLPSSVERVDLEYSLGSLERLSPTKRQCIAYDQNDPSSMGSSGSRRRKDSSVSVEMISAAAALKPKFWKEAATVSDGNVASNSFSVADDDGGSSPLTDRWEVTNNNDQERRLSAEEQRSIAEAEDVMRFAALAAETTPDGDSTPATSPNFDVKNGKAEHENETSNKASKTMTENKDKCEMDDFEKQIGNDDEDEDNSAMSSASSFVESLPGGEISKPIPPAPPSTPATAKDLYQPLPYQPDGTGGELAYGVGINWHDGEVTGGAGGVLPSHLSNTRGSLPAPPFYGDDAVTPLPDEKVKADSCDTLSEKSTPTPSQESNSNSNFSGEITEPRKGGADLNDTSNKRKRQHDVQKDKESSQRMRLMRKTEFDAWDVGDRYELKRMLGRGSYGEVAQAIDLYATSLRPTLEASQSQTPQGLIHQNRNPSYVAVKKISKAFDQEVDATRLFREMHILRRLRGHECIIKLIDVVQPRSSDLKLFNDLYLVFEYVDTDLYKLIMSPQYLTTEHVQTFLYQMLLGLKFIHSSSVIHRDLKPANILLNEDCTLKICDFGLARIVHHEKEQPAIMTPARTDQLGMGPAGEQVLLSTVQGDDPLIELSQPNLSRQLTKHVVTRWYRAPELILIQPYTSAVDIWSLGCIFAELLSMQEVSVPSYQDRVPLFPGGSCYPLSGDTGTTGSDERLDQLSVIFSIIGMPSEEDLKSVGKANEYIRSLERKPGKDLSSLYPGAHPQAIDLLKKMLEFNPKNRCSADEALEHDFLKSVRRKDMERCASQPLDSPGFLESNKIDLTTLKEETYKEVLWYRQSHLRSEV
mmetsp:Transcript_7453/g.15947  ORF Transcript_7453/g.15947 Transcript_7453/m.15947 type:complete len:937 (-) Transcript_7453:96-2906(-)